MASEIRVNKIENRSGLGTVTFADTGVDLAGIVTATTFSGSGASLTNIPDSALSAVTASKLTGALPATSGASLTGMASTDNVRTGILDVAGISTFRNTMNVGAAVTISESGIEASGIGITCANINGTQIGGRRNLIINGAMEVAQRGTSSTQDGLHSVDRLNKDEGGTDESVTQSQVDVASGTTPYTEGFRKAFRLTNGNQTGGADVQDYTRITYKIEAQDLAKCGWNYTSTSSFVTLQFWIKSSVAQNFYFIFNSADGGQTRSYVMETGSLSADTWTKITKTFPGDSQLAFDNDNGIGCYLYIYGYLGTSYADNSVSVNAWKNVANPQTPVNTTTWWTTNDATLEITGLQLEVGPQATAFEHRSFGEELSLCQRYYYVHLDSGSSGKSFMNSNQYSSNASYGHLQFACTMRTSPSLEIASGTNYYGVFGNATAQYVNDLSTVTTSPNGAELGGSTSMGQGNSVWWRAHNANSRVAFTAEI